MPTDTGAPVNEVLWTASTMFGTSKYIAMFRVRCFPSLLALLHRLSSPRAKATDWRRVWFFTNDQTPHRGDKTELGNAKQRAQVLSILPPPLAKRFVINRNLWVVGGLLVV